MAIAIFPALYLALTKVRACMKMRVYFYGLAVT
jgi:hypothetical protein